MRSRIPALLVLLPLAAACGRHEEAPYEEIRPVRSTVVGVDTGTVGATYSGQVRARYESKLGFQTSGKVSARLVELGSHVRRGQPLMRLDPEQEVLQVVSAAAEVEAARSKVADLKVDLQRTEQLFAREFASQAELDQDRLMLEEAEYQLESSIAKHQLKLNQRAYTEIVADRDGLVTALNAEVGQVVSAGQAVVTVAADGEREILVSIPESRVAELSGARALRISLWAHPGRHYQGSLRELAPDTDSVTRTYSARIAVKDPDAALMLGMTASVFAPDVGGGNAVRLPLSAIYDRDGQPRVWVIDTAGSRVATRAVQLGSAEDDHVVIAGGLAHGEMVVTAGVHMLHEGQKVLTAAAPVVARTAAP